jgi:hypothetical protein
MLIASDVRLNLEPSKLFMNPHVCDVQMHNSSVLGQRERLEEEVGT